MANLIFDYDGTLHNGVKIYAPAFRLAYERLVSLGFAKPQEWTEEEISHWMGYTPEGMWDTFMPDLAKEEKDASSKLIEREMGERIRRGKAQLYEGAEETLAALKEAGYTLLFLSNCTTSYMNDHRKAFNLDRFFEDFYCGEDFAYIPKYEIFKTIREQHPGEYAVIGDRGKDLEIAVHHGLPSIGCTYGYAQEGELDKASKLCKDVREIPELLKELNI